MGYVQRALLYSAVGIPMLAAQDTSKLPFAMEKALDRIAKGQAFSSADRPIVMARNTGTFVMPEPFQPPVPHVCSVPLLEMHVENPGRFAIERMKPQSTIDAMPLATMPAPPCEKTRQ